MLGLSASQIRRHINDLVKSGYISKRNNPKYKWDRTLQYRVNLVNIAKALKKNGYPLSDYKINIPDESCSITHPCAINNVPTKNQTCANERAIPEITNKDYNTENTIISPTELNSFSKEKATSPMGLNSSISKRNKEGGENNPDKWIATKTHIEICMERKGYSKEAFETAEAIEIVRTYYEKYREVIGKPHPRLNDKTMMFVVGQYLRGFGDGDSSVQTYRDLIDFHFATKYREDIDWTIQHFMSGEVREKLLYHNML